MPVREREERGLDMARDSLHAAIDLGTSKVTTLMARLGRDGVPELIGVGISPSQGVRKGVVVNIQEAQDSVRESVDEAIRSSGVSSPGAHVGITGDHLRMSVRRASVRSPYYNAPITSDAIDRSIQAIKPLDLPPEQQLLHIVPLSYAVDGLKGVRNPIGMHALRLDLEALCVVGGSAPVQNLSRAVAGSKVVVRSLVASSLAVGESVLTRDEKEMGVVLLEIGGGATTVSVFQQGRLCNAVVLPVGGYQFTTDLSVALNSPFDIAEEVKLRFGHVIPEEIGGEQVEVEAFGDRRTVKVERREVCRYLHDRAEEILRLAALKVSEFGFPAMLPAGIVLTGGGASLPGMEKLARRIFNKPIRLGLPGGLEGLPDGLEDPAYAASVGTLLWGVQNSEMPKEPLKRGYQSNGVTNGHHAGSGGLMGWFKGRGARHALR